MEYKKIGETFYVRMDRGDEIISNILEICRKESIPSAIFSGIGGCSNAELQVFIPETGSFETEQLEGMLELVSCFHADDSRIRWLHTVNLCLDRIQVL
jgi:predicted DNA-binding protein with PD1-like motif